MAALGALLLLAAGVRAQSTPDRDSRREQWQKVAEVMAALEVGPGSAVADIGAGRGFFTTRLASQVGADGRVFAVDIDRGNVERLARLATDDGLTQVTAIHGEPADPKLPPGAVDAALVVNAYHEFREHEAMLAAVLRALKPGGRLVIVEPLAAARREESRERQTRSHEIAPGYVQADLAAAGFTVATLIDPFTTRPEGDEMWLIVAKKP